MTDFQELLARLGWLEKIVGPVWALLTFIIVWMIFSIRQQLGWRNSYNYLLLILLAVIYAHPVYTGIFPSYVVTQVGNIFSLLFTVFVCWKVVSYARNIGLRLLPQIFWMIAATGYTWLKMKAGT